MKLSNVVFWNLTVLPPKVISETIACVEKENTLEKVMEKVAELYMACFSVEGRNQMFPNPKLMRATHNNVDLTISESKSLKEEFKELLLAEFRVNKKHFVRISSSQYCDSPLGKAVTNVKLFEKYSEIFDALRFDEKRQLFLELDQEKGQIKVNISEGGKRVYFI